MKQTREESDLSKKLKMEYRREYRRWVFPENNTSNSVLTYTRQKEVLLLCTLEEGFGQFKTNLGTVKATGRQVEEL